MLYTFSHAQYDRQQLQAIFAQLQADDAVLLWQDGVLQAVKNPDLFAQLPNLFLLENDLQARGLQTPFPTLTLPELVALTERYFPQVAF